MAQDLKKMFENDVKAENGKMPDGHEARFLNKLENELPKKPKTSKFSFFNIAASIVILLGLMFGTYQFLSVPNAIEGAEVVITPTEKGPTKSIGAISPELKKVEDYYLASINLELSKLKTTPENKELLDGYLLRLSELKKEYNLLAEELLEQGLNQQTINASIENLKLQLNLMYRLNQKINELNTSETNDIG